MAKIKKQMKGGSKVVGKKGKTLESDQERQLRFEIERMKAEEEARAKEAARKNELKNRQDSEKKHANVNRLKILTQWRKLMRLVKVEDLRKEIEIISQQHEREVDRKDAIIQVLDRDLEESEDQYQMALRAHLVMVDRLIDMHNARLRNIEYDFEKDLQELVDEFGAERAEMNASHARHKKEMLDILAQMEMDFTEEEGDARAEFESTREEIKNRNSEEYNILRFTLEGLIEELERHFDSAHQNYMATTEVRTQDFKTLTRNDQKSARTIEQQMRRLQRLQDQIAHWKQKLSTNARKCEERNKAMKAEKDAIFGHFQELKGRMNKFREREAARLQELSINSNAAISTLTERKKVAERILSHAELCRYLETEREKVLPFYASSVEDEEKASFDADKVRSSLQSAAATKDGQPVEEWNCLDNFFKRYNKVLLDVLAIERERARLRSENGDLRSILKQYLDGISVNEDVINNPNPLLVVNHKTNIVMPAAHQRPPPNTTVEGMHAVRSNPLTDGRNQLHRGRQGASI